MGKIEEQSKEKRKKEKKRKKNAIRGEWGRGLGVFGHDKTGT